MHRARFPHRSALVVLATFLLSAVLASALEAQVLDEPDPLSEKHARWLKEVEPILFGFERVAFERLDRDYQRDAFIKEFWKVRDPYPRTARNELEERWPLRVAEAKNKWGTLQDDRSRMLLVQGPPDNVMSVQCTKSRSPAEVWAYRGTDWTDIDTVLIFYRLRGQGPARLWVPSKSGIGAEQALRAVRGCINGSQMLQLVGVLQGQLADYEKQLAALLQKPRPSSTEWVYSFEAMSTDMPYDGQAVAGELEFVFRGRYQNRTLVQMLATVDASDMAIGEYAGYRSYEFQLNGEVLGADGELFERFRYKFGFPADDAPERIPLSFQRLLRPGEYTLVLLVDDLGSNKVFRVETELAVPRSDQAVELPTFQNPETERLFAEATAALAAGETGLRLIPPAGELQTGFTRFDALASGDEIAKVRFLLDDKLILTKNRPPFQVSIDLGPYPDLRTLRAEALDPEGTVVAEDELLINTGGYRFVAKLREPRAGKRYEKSLQARVEVEVPDGRSLERVEIYLDEALVATLYQEPFVQPIVLPRKHQVAYVRAVAYLPDGNSTEDLVFINAEGQVEEVDVQFVELYTSVLDDQGRPVTEIDREAFRIREDGEPQTIARFEQVRDLPIHVGILLDTSASMGGVLDEVQRAALDFVDQALEPKDRAAVMTFNNFPELRVELTNDKVALGAGFAGLSAEGRTALYDSVMFGLYYFTGIRGQRALLVLSDGRDESSRFDFEQTLEYARRAGITLYTIGLRLGDPGARRKLARLAEETGGSSHFIGGISELDEIYARIEEELRSQLLIAYQSTQEGDSKEFRRIEIEVDRPGVTARTISGYYP